MHRISDARVGGESRRNLKMFRKLCGEEAAQNVLFVTTMWDNVDPQTAVQREKELATKEEFFKPMLSHGAKMHRHDNSVASAQNVVSQLVLNMQRRVTLQLQQELVDDGLNIANTAAGKELLSEQERLMKKQRQELQEVQQSLLQAQRQKDTQTHEELTAERRDLLSQIRKVEQECERLAEEYAAKKKELHDKVSEAMKTLHSEKEARIAADIRLGELKTSMNTPCSETRKDPKETPNCSKKTLWGIGFMTLVKVIDIALNLAEMVAQTH